MSEANSELDVLDRAIRAQAQSWDLAHHLEEQLGLVDGEVLNLVNSLAIQYDGPMDHVHLRRELDAIWTEPPQHPTGGPETLPS